MVKEINTNAMVKLDEEPFDLMEILTPKEPILCKGTAENNVKLPEKRTKEISVKNQAKVQNTRTFGNNINVQNKRKTEDNGSKKKAMNTNHTTSIEFSYPRYLTALDKALEIGNLEMITTLARCVEPAKKGREIALERAAEGGYLKAVQNFIERDIHSYVSPDMLYKAAKNGHVEVVKYLVKHGADIRTKLNVKLYEDAREECEDVFDFFVCVGDLEMVQYLKKRGIDIHRGKDKSLFKAAMFNHFDIVKYLVQNGAKNPAALFGAAINDNLEMTKYLVEHGANISTYKDSALCSASSRGNLEIVTYLIEKGANIHTRDEKALRDAASWGHLEVVKCLIEHGADIHAEEDEAFRRAVEHRKTDVIRYLVEHGANIHAREDEALQKAAGWGNLEIVKYLVKHGADIHANDDKALREARDWCRMDVAEYLTEQGAGLPELDSMFPEMTAATTNAEEEIGFLNQLIAQYADSDEKLNATSERLLLETIHFFAEKGTNIYENDDELFRIAVKKGNLKIVECLVEYGADIHACNDEAIREAVKRGYTDIVKYLIEHGADINTRISLSCNNILDYYMQKKDTEMIQFLTTHGADTNNQKPSFLSVIEKSKAVGIIKSLMRYKADVHAKKADSITSEPDEVKKGEVKKTVAPIKTEPSVMIHKASPSIRKTKIAVNVTVNDKKFCEALEKDDFEQVKYLVEHGTKVHSNDDAALCIAVTRENLEIVKYLVEHGANVNANDTTPLFRAVEKNNIDIVKYLVEHGAKTNKNGDAAIWMAIEKGNLEILKCLIQNRGGVKENDKATYCRTDTGESVKRMHFLAEKERDIYEKANNLFIDAAEKGYSGIVKYLVECGADVRLNDDIALKYYIDRNNVDMIRYLAEHGADISGNAGAVLEKGLECGNIEMIKIVEHYCPEKIVAFSVDFSNVSADERMAYNYLRSLKTLLKFQNS